jgi:hypothetical protein
MIVRIGTVEIIFLSEASLPSHSTTGTDANGDWREIYSCLLYNVYKHIFFKLLLICHLQIETYSYYRLVNFPKWDTSVLQAPRLRNRLSFTPC